MADEMEYPPRKIIAMIRAGMRDDVLLSNSMWYCLSCYTCTARCPKNVKPTELAHALESLAIQQGFNVRKTRTPAMYRSFVSSVKGAGRVYDFGMMAWFYLTTNPLAPMKLLPVLVNLIRHGRLSLIPHRAKGTKELKQILQKFDEIRGA
jgi:heterodisulfide reductase subunit C